MFWIFLFAAGTFVIWTREVDGAGAVQTPGLRWFAFVLLVVAFLIPLGIQLGWRVVNQRIE